MYDQTIPRRIRNRREDRQLAGYQLAKMADISPSYLSLIESGQKLPSKEVAERLARALGDDPEVYRAWVETADDPDLEARVERTEKLRQMQAPIESKQGLSLGLGKLLHRRGRSRAGAERALPSKRVAKDAVLDEMPLLARHLEAPAMLRAPFEDLADLRPDPDSGPQTRHVPLLDESTDPAKVDQEDAGMSESISIDTSLIPRGAGRLFAYRATVRSTERIGNLVRPDDVLVFAADPEGVDPAAIYAVRVNHRIVLSRIVYTQPTLLLIASDLYHDPLTLDVGDEDGLFRALAGVVVAGVRSWPMPPKLERRGSKVSLGRSGKLEDGNIVRDCEWKENYGWRPVQKAEDMDYLDEHPGTTVQFRLLRDGDVKYVLELDPEQWREALGSYYEGPTWRRNGYIVAITKRVKGEYTEEFQDRWVKHVRRAEGRDR